MPQQRIIWHHNLPRTSDYKGVNKTWATSSGTENQVWAKFETEYLWYFKRRPAYVDEALGRILFQIKKKYHRSIKIFHDSGGVAKQK